MKKSTYLIAIALGVSTISLAQNVGINTDGSDPDTDALLHLLNTNSTALDPLIRLENQQNASVNGIELLNSGGATAAEWDLYIPSSTTDFRVSNGTTDHVTIQNDGDVGIGTSTPTVPLDIEATNAAIDINNTSTDPLIHFQVSGTTNFTIGTDVTDSKFKIGTTALETGTAITVQSTGEVGIGTASPTATLDVDGSAIFNESGAAVDFKIEGDTDTELFYVDGSADAIGIGTSTPDYELTISAQATGGGANGILRLTGRSDKDNMIRFDYPSNSTNNWLLGVDFNVGEGDIFSLYNSVRGEYDLTVEQSDGFVGIGTSTPTVPLDIEAAGAAIDINNTSTDPLIHFQVSGTTNFTIGTDVTDSKFKIGTTALETGTAITVQSTGEVGIGTTSPTAKFEVDGSAIFNESGAAVDFRVEGDTEANLLFVDASADAIGIGTSTPDSKVHVYNDFSAYSGLKLEHTASGFQTEYTVTPGYVAGVETDQCVTMDVDGAGWFIMMDNLRLNGNVYPYADNTFSCGINGARWTEVWATNGTIQTSDRRLKTNIDSLNYGLEEVMQLKPVSFKWKDDSTNTNKIGYIAQDVQKVIPEVINGGKGENQYLGMNYGEMVVVLTKAIQEQQAIIESQKKEIATEKAENESQKAEIENLKQATSSSIQRFEAIEAKLNALLLNQNVTLSAKK